MKEVTLTLFEKHTEKLFSDITNAAFRKDEETVNNGFQKMNELTEIVSMLGLDYPQLVESFSQVVKTATAEAAYRWIKEG